MTAVIIRALCLADRDEWVRMRSALWPDQGDHPGEIEMLLADPEAWAFVAVAEDGAPAGFAEVQLRKCANGCETQPVPFLEGIWVNPQFRRQGVGAALIAHVEAVLSERGFRELGSDARLENALSQNAHQAWGFTETERVVCFHKLLTRST